jgi:drug/metabolite transporter (DMT)-like permease
MDLHEPIIDITVHLDSFVQIDSENDGKKRAFIAMNIHVLLYTGVNTLFKLLKADGVTPIDFMLFRSLFVLITSSFILKRKQINPFTSVPTELRFWLFARVFIGVGSFVCFTFCIGMLPLSLLTIVV